MEKVRLPGSEPMSSGQRELHFPEYYITLKTLKACRVMGLVTLVPPRGTGWKSNPTDHYMIMVFFQKCSVFTTGTDSSARRKALLQHPSEMAIILDMLV